MRMVLFLLAALVSSPLYSATNPKVQPVEVTNLVPTVAVNRMEYFPLSGTALNGLKDIYVNDTESAVLFVGLSVGMDIADSCGESYAPGFVKFYVFESYSEVAAVFVPLVAESFPEGCAYLGTSAGDLVVGPGQKLAISVQKKGESIESFYVTARASGYTLP